MFGKNSFWKVVAVAISAVRGIGFLGGSSFLDPSHPSRFH